MRAQFSNYSIDKLNKDLNQMLDGKLVNFFKLFVMTEPDTKLSVTLLPMDIYNNRYHGLHPKFDEAYLRKFLTNYEVNESGEFLIVAQRDEKSIDAGEFYSSANGQSEFMDKHVSFYKESVFEDLPSMNYNSDYRVDLNNEIRREVIAELGITALNSEWDYLGVSYLAINQEKNKNDQGKPTKRRMHFNVLTSNKTSLDFKAVVAN